MSSTVDAVCYLVCPHCGRCLERLANTLACPGGHRFDLARQGYVSLLTGAAPVADTTAMVAARSAFLAGGHFGPLVDQLRRRDPRADGPVLDLGSGPGHYLAALLEPVPRPALALDASKAAARRAAKAHPGITAVVCDAWRRLPIRSASMALALNVFAPRNPDELSRVLRQDGRLLVITPTPEHLRELVGALDLLSVAADKRRRLDDQLDPVLRRTEDDTVTFELSLNRVEAATLVAMGPNAWHTRSARVESILAGIAEPIRATASVRITEWSPRPGRHH